MEKIVALCRRRGFIFGSSEIYGGIGGFWDYGPLGCELKRNVKDCWWSDMVRNPPPGPDGTPFQMVGVDCSIIMNPKVWEASGHVSGFSDPMRDCKECKLRFRSDLLMRTALFEVNKIPESTSVHEALAEIEGKQPVVTLTVDATPGTDQSSLIPAVKRALRAKKASLKVVPATVGSEFYFDVDGRYFYYYAAFTGESIDVREVCPNCGGELTEERQFNLMFESHAGALKDDTNKVYLRPETAQGIFANFKNVMDSTRVKIPFGIAQIGKAFRNEINPRNYTFRSREFEQMEIEFFCKPETSKMWYEFWRDVRIKWYESLGIKSEKLKPREQGEDELAHYSDACTDIEYLFPFSEETQELEGVAHRGDFDLKAHGKASKGNENAFAVIDDAPSRGLQPARTAGNPGPTARYVPHVIEPSAGVDRFTLAAICEAYSYDENRASPEFMKFHPRLAPIKAAVFPLVAKDGMPEVAVPVFEGIRKLFPCQYDAKQTIGKRYARMDEAGTPFCFTIDGQSKEDGTVTVRNRDDASQQRIDKSRCGEYLRDKLGL
jgi:glycyl-tRNA synthetase